MTADGFRRYLLAGVVTFIPKWLVEGELKARWRTTAFLLAVYIVVAVLNYFNKASAL